MMIDEMMEIGEEIEIEKGYEKEKERKGIVGERYKLKKVQVGEKNVMMMEEKMEKGEKIIENEEREKEVEKIEECIKEMGEKIRGEGRRKINVKGVKNI